ncbi:MAG TPA: bifunctional phosphopantothenoylcysteine decarboxylase/phosphopantothenate--cysteine ligase CoaBC [Chitinophagaceae bacterium]|nr:bifunctional phosphopantothenoylcysteine decarboxylase/phosphopantothenate--cysteine ligase CoaBC [Chitinophagaceae bacterium]
MLKGKKILLGITGSIAAYKSAFLVRLLVKAGADVKVIMTPSSTDFISKLTFSTLSKNKVLVDLFDEESWANHVMLGRWADMMLIAPLSCNTLSKMAHGQCDNLLLAVYLSATCPVVVAPAMDEDMWHHQSTKENIGKLTEFGNKIIPVDKGELASGLIGDGRMAEPEAIVRFIEDRFNISQSLSGKKAFVSAGPTYEPIDPVRFIGNHSTGKMGLTIAEELYARGADVTLIMGPSLINLPANGIKSVRVNTAEEMYNACTKQFDRSDIGVMAAAVADYTPIKVAASKIKKTSGELIIELKKTKDILKTLGKKKSSKQILVGFALETNNEREYALGKLKNKNADMVVLNSLNDKGAGFGTDTNKITIFDKSGKEFNYDLMSKKEAAKNIVDTIIQLYYA